MPIATKRSSNAAGDVRATLAQELAELPSIHDTLRLWRYCRHKPCKRARRCCGDAQECTRRFPRITLWVQRLVEGESAGLSTLEAIRAASRQVFDGRGVRAMLGALKTTQVETKL